jgi:hypothetical protein
LNLQELKKSRAKKEEVSIPKEIDGPGKEERGIKVMVKIWLSV